MSEDFLSRWSRLKRAGTQPASAPPPATAPRPATAAPPAPGVLPAAANAAEPAAPPPPIESLEPGADIAQFMRAGVDQALKRQALRKLLQDPRFNVMDGLDVYIDDYSQPDPLPEGWLEKMSQTLRLGDYHEPEAEQAHEAAPAEAPPEPSSRPQEPVESTGSPADAAAVQKVADSPIGASAKPPPE